MCIENHFHDDWCGCSCCQYGCDHEPYFDFDFEPEANRPGSIAEVVFQAQQLFGYNTRWLCLDATKRTVKRARKRFVAQHRKNRRIYRKLTTGSAILDDDLPF